MKLGLVGVFYHLPLMVTIDDRICKYDLRVAMGEHRIAPSFLEVGPWLHEPTIRKKQWRKEAYDPDIKAVNGKDFVSILAF